MSLFRKPKRNIQRRVFSTLDEEEESVENNEVPMEIDGSEILEDTTEKNKKKKDNKHKNKEKDRKLLSFEDDEDNGETFRVKKSSYSKKVMRQLDKERKRKRKQPDGEEYPTLDSIQQSDNIIRKIKTDDMEIVLKRSEPDLILNGQAAFTAGKNDLSDDEYDQPFHKFAHLDAVKEVLEKGKIPDAAMIHAVRKKRQKAREGYIPIATPEVANKGRLVREDGDGDGSDEDADRVDMTVNTQTKDRAERSEKFYEAQELLYDRDSGDSEIEEWEKQQIRKGVTGAQVVSAQQESLFYIKNQTIQDGNLTSGSFSLLRQVYATAGIAPPIPFERKTDHERTADEVENSLRVRLSELKGAHKNHKEDLERLNDDLRKVKLDADIAEKRVPEFKCKYKFYQEIRGYILDLVECLDEKLPIIVSCEQRALTLMSKESNLLIERRRQDIRDQACSEKPTPGRLDDEELTRRTAEREGRRARRRRAREKHITQAVHLEGMSSDDEVPDQQQMSYQKQMDQLTVDANLIFSDASEEFSNVKGVLECFEQWQKEDITTYNETYVCLCIPKVIGPYLRLALVSWNPLKPETNNDFEKMSWYRTLAIFGLQENESESDLTTSDNALLIPTVVEKVMLPKITDIIRSCWDPMSTSQTLRLVSLISRLVKEYPRLQPTSKALLLLFETILDKIKSALENDVFIPIMTKQTAFFQRQFANGLKLLRNMLSFQGVITDSILMGLAFGALLNRYLIPAVRVCKSIDAAQKIYLITNTLPRVWLQSTRPPQLDMFKDCVINVNLKLDKNNPTHLESIETTLLVMKTLHI